jgi:hypothetical protein
MTLIRRQAKPKPDLNYGSKAMTTDRTRTAWHANPWRVAGWGLAATLLLVPLVAMQFTDEVYWTASDFLFMGVLLGAVGLGFEWIGARSRNLAFRGGAAIALITAFLTVWVNAAVGMIGSEHDDYNVLFAVALLIALGGSVAARLAPRGTMWAMTFAAAAQAGLAVVGWSSDARGGLLALAFALPWLLAALLFARAQRQASVAAG